VAFNDGVSLGDGWDSVAVGWPSSGWAFDGRASVWLVSACWVFVCCVFSGLVFAGSVFVCWAVTGLVFGRGVSGCWAVDGCSFESDGTDFGTMGVADADGLAAGSGGGEGGTAVDAGLLSACCFIATDGFAS
jgi:hypothetical protein